VKTVFVLGAGFSYGANVPLQAQLLSRLRALSVVDIPSEPFGIFADATSRALPFLKRAFRTLEPSLEDVFTLLDQAIARREHCAGLDWDELDEVRESLKTAILIALHAAQSRATEGSLSFYRGLAAHLLFEGWGRARDSVSIVSLNWDTLLEDSIHWCLSQEGLLGRVDVNYGCDSQPLGASPHVPSFEQGRDGFFGLRVLKPHGSVNWLVCPACGRLFTGLGSPIGSWAQYCLPQSCPSCNVMTSGVGSPVLRPLYVTPTFLKSFDSLHLQNVWHRAFLDLSTAESVVFVGYSFPEADYHLRTLFRRAIQGGTKVTCVLVPSDAPTRSTPRRLRPLLPVSRYEAFFGADRVKVSTTGTERWFKTRMDGRSDKENVARLRRRARARLRPLP
jgi:hypothetical protein